MKLKKLFLSITMIGVVIMTSVSAKAANSDTENPNLTIEIDSAAVTVQKSTDSKISVDDYDTSVFSVTINQDDKDWKVDIHSIINPNVDNSPLTLYLPEQSYNDIITNVKYGHFDNKTGVFKSGNLTGTYHMGSVYHTLPLDFTGNVTINAEGGMTQVTSKDNYADSDVTLTNDGQKWTAFVYAPSKFAKSADRKVYTYTDGTAINTFKLTLTGQGVIEMD